MIPMPSPQFRLDSMPQTLTEAHEALSKVRPGRAASLDTWRAFRQLAARLYTEMADIDRYHHHEALYWASYERTQADEITRQMGLTTGRIAPGQPGPGEAKGGCPARS